MLLAKSLRPRGHGGPWAGATQTLARSKAHTWCHRSISLHWQIKHSSRNILIKIGHLQEIPTACPPIRKNYNKIENLPYGDDSRTKSSRHAHPALPRGGDQGEAGHRRNLSHRRCLGLWPGPAGWQEGSCPTHNFTRQNVAERTFPEAYEEEKDCDHSQHTLNLIKQI